MGKVSRAVSARRSQQQDALRRAFEVHYVPLLRLCIALAGRREVAEDIVQDAFVRIAGKIDELEEGDVGPYLRRVVVNLWRDRLRRFATEVRHRFVRTQAQLGWEGVSDEREVVWQALRRLPVRQRACVVLRYYEDLSVREAAGVLGCTVGTVKSQTSRALSKLGKVLSHED